MIIGIDYRLANSSTRGMGSYCREITRRLLKKDTANTYILYVDRKLSHTIELPSNVIIKNIGIKNFIIDEQIFLAFRTFKDKLNVLWSPYNTFPLFANSRTKLYVTVHDLIFLHNIKEKSTIIQKIGKLYRKYCLLLGKKRIFEYFTVSQYSQKEIEQKLCVNSGDITITSNCIDDDFRKNLLAYKQEEKSAKNDFYFTLSGDAPSKNLKFVIRYFQKYLPDKKLYIAGLYNSSRLRKYSSDYIIFLPQGLEYKELIKYYFQCEAFLFLSLYEGFGRPVIEALFCGAKIIASNRTAVPEAAGNCAILIDPQSQTQLTKALCDIKRFSASEQIKEAHLKKHSDWSSTAETVYQAILKTIGIK